jgi:phage terminase Nu1 subunit (DNA packaging protein)
MTTELLTRSQVAALLDVEPRSLSRYAKADDPLLPVKAAHGKPSLYDPTTVGQWLIRRELARLQRAAGHHDPIHYDQERARLTRAQADAQELKNKITRRQYARVELLSYALGNTCSQISAKLETIPGRLKREIPKLNNSELFEVRRIITEVQNAAAEAKLDWSQAPAEPIEN